MNRSLRPLSSILMPICGEIGLSERLRIETLRGKWREILGEPMSTHTYPAAIDKGSLVVNVDSPVWLQELKFAKTEFRNKLKGFSVTSVRFRHGKTYWNSVQDENGRNPLPGRPSASQRSCSPEESTWADSITEAIADPELISLVRRTIKKALANKTTTKPGQ